MSTINFTPSLLNVFWEEPPDHNDSIFNYNIMATPHIGGSTDVSMRGIVKGVAEGQLPYFLHTV
jgi:phosphoglycerate dehydrogenase-like enzyme